jgi:hypothetical protein
MSETPKGAMLSGNLFEQQLKVRRADFKIWFAATQALADSGLPAAI